MSIPSVEEVFRPIIGVPCWGATHLYGSMLSFQFGPPHQTIGRVYTRKRTGKRRRIVRVKGDYELFIDCCGWRFYDAGVELAHSESPDNEIGRVCAILNGQALERVEVHPDTGNGRFVFDLDGRLDTGPVDEDLLDQWSLSSPDGMRYTYRSDGKASYTPGDAQADAGPWFEVT